MTSPDSDSHAPPITYIPTVWTGTTQITAARLNNAETGVTQCYTVLNAHDERLDALDAAPGLAQGINQASKGPSTARPAPALDLYFYDTTLNKPIWGDGTNWRDYTGTIVSGAGGSNAPVGFLATTQPDNTILNTWTAVGGATTYKLYESQYPTGVPGAATIPSTSYTFTPPATATAVQVVQEKAFEITSTAENSTKDWTAQYTYIQDIGDNRGYTGGIVGFTSATLDMLTIVKNWTAIAPGNILAKYIPGLTTCTSIGIGSGASSAAASNLGSAFITAWHTASADPVWQQVQRDYRESVYWTPAYTAAIADGLGPLGQALYYDTSVNHGPGVANSNDGSFDDIRSRTTGTKPSNGGSETTWLTNFINVRSAVLSGPLFNDNPSDGRITMFRAFVTAANFSLTCPFSWSIYGDSFTMSVDPTPAGITANRTYDLWVTASVSGVETAASNHDTATVPYGSGTGVLPTVAAGADATVAHSATFTRTGVVTGSGITASGWRLVVTPADDNTAAKNLSWGQPLSASDEFEYTGPPDPAKWGVYDGPGHAGNGIRNPARCTVGNGKLTLQGTQGSANTGGMASALNQQYGKWEVRMRNFYTNNPSLPGTDANGYHPVCIVWPSDDVWPQHGEYDFIENDVPGMQSTDGFIHYPSKSSTNYQEELPAVACDMRQFHNFAIEWTSAFIKTYIDGVLWATLSGGGNSTRNNIQDMPLGQLTIQLDAFQTSGLTASTMELEWARIYPLVPVNPNTSLSSTAALSWAAPSTPGTYTLELFATNSAGTATDQITVTVT